MRDSLSRCIGAGLACLFALSGIVSGAGLATGPAWAAGDVTPMVAAPGMLKKTGHEGPWHYGCAFPDKASQEKGVTCTLGRILVGEDRVGAERPAGNKPEGNKSGEKRPDGLLMLLHATPDSARQKLENQPWALAFLLPPEQQVDRAVPARLVVDHGNALSIPWQDCTAQGCNAQLTSLSDEVMFHFNHGRLAQLEAQKPDGGRWVFDVPLDNLQNAMQKMTGWIQHGGLSP